MTEGEAVVEDYVAMRLTLRSHPVALIRDRLSPGIDGRLLTTLMPIPVASQYAGHPGQSRDRETDRRARSTGSRA